MTIEVLVVMMIADYYFLLLLFISEYKHLFKKKEGIKFEANAFDLKQKSDTSI